MKATIEVTHNEMFTSREYFHKIEFGFVIHSWGFKLYFDENNLSKLLYFLPQNHVLRNRLQREGERCFGW